MQVDEEDLLRSIEEVEAKIQNFRQKVRDVLDAVQSDTQTVPAKTGPQSAT